MGLLSKPFDLAIAGELNLEFVLYGLPTDLPLERDVLASGFVVTLGSSSAIAAHNAAALGLRVMLQSVVGADEFGRMAWERLRQIGVDVRGVVFDPALTTGITVLLPHAHGRRSFTHLGSIRKLATTHLDVERLKQARHCTSAHSTCRRSFMGACRVCCTNLSLPA